jgi:hypothetical protein
MRGNHKIVVARVNYQITHRNRRQIAAFILCPIDARRRAKSKDRVPCRQTPDFYSPNLPYNVSVTAYRRIFGDNPRPGFPKSDVL